MSAQSQSVGLTNFVNNYCECPPDGNGVRSIVFTSTGNLAVVNGPTTELSISLSDFFMPVSQAIRSTFTVPGTTSSYLPYNLYKLDTGGSTGQVKFIALFPNYDTAISSNSSNSGSCSCGCGCGGHETCGSSSSSNINSMFLEWTTLYSINEGLLYTENPLGSTGNTNFDFFEVNDLDFSWGGYIRYDNEGVGSMYAATNGGLLKWNGQNSILWNTLNSSLATDYLNCLEVDSSNNIWIGSNNGILQFNESGTTLSIKQLYTTSNSLLGSNIVNDIKKYSTDQIAVATDAGLSIFNTGGTAFSTYNIYNSPLLRHNKINTLTVSSEPYIFVGTTGGVYVFNPSQNIWNSHPLNSSTVNGWTAPNNIQSITSLNGILYVGTTGGLVVIPYSGMTGATAPLVGVTGSVILAGVSGPYSDNFRSLRISSYEGNQLYVGHGDDGISVYNIDDDQWWFAQGASGPITSVLPDSQSGISGSQTLYFSNNLGISKYLTNTLDLSSVPDSTTNTDLLFSIPRYGTSSGNYLLDTSQLYSTEQPIYFLFSKDVGGSGSSFESFMTLKTGIGGTGSTVSGAWSWDSTGKIGIFTPTELSKASGYNLLVAIGATAVDGTYLTQGMNVGFYTENISPENGWNILGKILILSGSADHPIDSIYLRNTSSMDITVTALIGY